MFRLAGDRTSVAADAFAVVDNESKIGQVLSPGDLRPNKIQRRMFDSLPTQDTNIDKCSTGVRNSQTFKLLNVDQAIVPKSRTK